LNEDDVVAIVRAHIEQRFPMTCSKCGHTFASLKEYLQYTTHVGNPISYDAELNEWRPTDPVGTLSFANCRCGTTLAISSHGMALTVMWRLLRWARKETATRNISLGELLDGLRKKIDQQVLCQNEAESSNEVGLTSTRS